MNHPSRHETNSTATKIRTHICNSNSENVHLGLNTHQENVTEYAKQNAARETTPLISQKGRYMQPPVNGSNILQKRHVGVILGVSYQVDFLRKKSHVKNFLENFNEKKKIFLEKMISRT